MALEDIVSKVRNKISDLDTKDPTFVDDEIKSEITDAIDLIAPDDTISTLETDDRATRLKVKFIVKEVWAQLALMIYHDKAKYEKFTAALVTIDRPKPEDFLVLYKNLRSEVNNYLKKISAAPVKAKNLERATTPGATLKEYVDDLGGGSYQ